MPPDPLLRRATPADYPHFVAIEESAARLFPAGRIPDPAIPYDRAAFERAIADGLTWFAEIAGRPVGLAIAEPLAGHLHLFELSVASEHAGRGLGSLLLERVKTDCRERSLPGVTLTTFADLPFNGPFYTRRGFAEIPADQLAPELAAILAAERTAGLTQRIAMRWRASTS